MLEAAPTTIPDVVVLKQFLTKLNGTAVATLLRTMPSTHAIPIVLYNTVGMSGASVDTAQVNDRVEGCDSADILSAVERTLGVRV